MIVILAIGYLDQKTNDGPTEYEFLLEYNSTVQRLSEGCLIGNSRITSVGMVLHVNELDCSCNITLF